MVSLRETVKKRSIPYYGTTTMQDLLGVVDFRNRKLNAVKCIYK
jgi:hypothetical protein